VPGDVTGVTDPSTGSGAAPAVGIVTIENVNLIDNNTVVEEDENQVPGDVTGVSDSSTGSGAASASEFTASLPKNDKGEDEVSDEVKGISVDGNNSVKDKDKVFFGIEDVTSIWKEVNPGCSYLNQKQNESTKLELINYFIGNFYTAHDYDLKDKFFGFTKEVIKNIFKDNETFIKSFTNNPHPLMVFLVWKYYESNRQKGMKKYHFTIDDGTKNPVHTFGDDDKNATKYHIKYDEELEYRIGEYSLSLRSIMN